MIERFDWDDIRREWEDGATLQALASEYALSIEDIEKTAKNGKWMRRSSVVTKLTNSCNHAGQVISDVNRQAVALGLQVQGAMKSIGQRLEAFEDAVNNVIDPTLKQLFEHAHQGNCSIKDLKMISEAVRILEDVGRRTRGGKVQQKSVHIGISMEDGALVASKHEDEMPSRTVIDIEGKKEDGEIPS